MTGTSPCHLFLPVWVATSRWGPPAHHLPTPLPPPQNRELTPATALGWSRGGGRRARGLPKVAHPSKAGVGASASAPVLSLHLLQLPGSPLSAPGPPPTLPRPPQQHQLCFSDPSQRALILRLRFRFESSWKHHKHLPGPGVCFLLLLIKRFRVISLRSLETKALWGGTCRRPPRAPDPLVTAAWFTCRASVSL